MTNDDLKLILTQIDKVDSKVNAISKDTNEMKQVVARQEIHLEHHIKRSDLIEKHLELVSGRIEPIEGWVRTFSNAFKIFGFITALLTCITGIVAVGKFLQPFLIK